jgi:hypothetical protein
LVDVKLAPRNSSRVAVLFVFSLLVLSACDRWDGLTVRNEGDEPLKVVWQLPDGREFPVYPTPAGPDSQTGLPVAPGGMAEAGYISGPPDPQRDLIVKGFSLGGTLVYCRRLAPSEYRGMTREHPLLLKPGDIGCN